MNIITDAFCLENARECVKASQAAYTGCARMDGATCFCLDVEATDTHAIVLKFDTYIIVAFRGTSSIKNWITDADFIRTLLVQQEDGSKCEVHRGFLKSIDSIIGLISHAIQSTRLPIFFTGHSLGGAQAVLAALDMQRQGFNVGQVYTFGQPRVGNASLVSFYEKLLGSKTFRVVYQEDIVPRVPLLPTLFDPYNHTNTEIFYPSNGKDFVVNPSIWTATKSNCWGIYRAFITKKFAGALDPLDDHHIANYVSIVCG